MVSINLQEYQYDLPQEKIAKFPLKERAIAKLLVSKGNKISHHKFKNLPDLLTEDSLLVFNDTKVIPARMVFYKDSGARIEVFLLEPSDPLSYEQNMSTKGSCKWKCMIGNSKRWKSGRISIEKIGLFAERNEYEVKFSWSSDQTFAEILEKAGEIPLPPYINREVTDHDKHEYQTVYSKVEGAVAAPTAGLHFTEELLQNLENKGIKKDYLTLHVSAGTFQPIKEDSVMNHPMHREQIIVKRKNIENLLNQERCIAVGTTSMRTLESTYWYGAKLLRGEKDFFIPKKLPYETENPPSAIQSLEAILREMDFRKTEKLYGHTEIFILPGYDFQICNGLVTNFHLPASTLLLLVAALIGEHWRDIYREALLQDYRFLSYGDGSLLIP